MGRVVRHFLLQVLCRILRHAAHYTGRACHKGSCRSRLLHRVLLLHQPLLFLPALYLMLTCLFLFAQPFFFQHPVMLIDFFLTALQILLLQFLLTLNCLPAQFFLPGTCTAMAERQLRSASNDEIAAAARAAMMSPRIPTGNS